MTEWFVSELPYDWRKREKERKRERERKIFSFVGGVRASRPLLIQAQTTRWVPSVSESALHMWRPLRLLTLSYYEINCIQY